jgi:alkanesulfonate monooxygenase SsuD/methylene tetrahydromethanopterin reductase-like flavin-dependent oxidoreductase (luciferase family)
MLLTRLGVMFQASRPVRELPELARHAEALGLDELWMAEDCFLHSGPAAASAALAVTERLSVGIGLLPVSVRNPAIAAMELATLANLYPSRTRVAFGHGVEAWMRQIGARPADRIVALEEIVGTVRSLLHGEEVSYTGRAVSIDAVALEAPPDPPPTVLIGTTGQRGVEVAGRVADGVLLPEGASAGAVAWVRDALGPDAEIVVYSWLRVDDDADRARAAVRPLVRTRRDGGMYPNLVRLGGVPGEGEIDDGAIDGVAIAGTAQQCADSVARLAAAGASTVVVVPVGDGVVEQLERVSADVAPRLGRG